MNNVLAIYNTCGLSGRNNSATYINHLRPILSQDCPGYRVVLSDCCNSEEVRVKLMEEFGDAMSYNFIDDKLPLNITCNATAKAMTERFGQFDSYLYIDSGVHFGNEFNVAKDLWQLLRSDSDYALVASRINGDEGYSEWRFFPYGNVKTIVPIGKTVNLHCQLYSLEYFLAYNQKLLPDIFASDTHESIYTFLTAAINKRFVIHPMLLNHHVSVDGPSIGFGRGRKLFQCSKEIEQIVHEGRQFGFGYEECQSVCVHIETMYRDGFLENPEPLYNWIVKNMFLSFDYNAIRQNLIIGTGSYKPPPYDIPKIDNEEPALAPGRSLPSLAPGR
jgi:hypothetical protein